MGLAAQQRHSQQAINIMHGKQQNTWQHNITGGSTAKPATKRYELIVT